MNYEWRIVCNKCGSQKNATLISTKRLQCTQNDFPAKMQKVEMINDQKQNKNIEKIIKSNINKQNEKIYQVQLYNGDIIWVREKHVKHLLT